MEDIFVARVMSTDLQTVSPDTLVEAAAERMLDADVGSLLVVDEDASLEGILTTTDFVRIVALSEPKANTPVSHYMTADVETASAQDPVSDVAQTMLEGGFHHMPVVDDRAGVVGLVSTTDLASYVTSLEHVTTS